MYSRKPTFEELPEAMTAIWTCTGENCKGWMRANFSFEDEPACPYCQSEMISEMRSLPILVNSSQIYGSLKSRSTEKKQDAGAVAPIS